MTPSRDHAAHRSHRVPGRLGGRGPGASTVGALADRLGLLGTGVRRTGDVTAGWSGVAILDEEVRPGDLYVVLPDNHATATEDADRAVRAGAAAICAHESLGLHPAVPLIEVTDERRALAASGAVLAGDPAADLELVGITGTNGKSTTAAMLTRCLEYSGRDTGLLGSFLYWAGDEATYSVTTPRHGAAHLTTPDGPRLHAALAAIAAAGDRTAVMEVTSQALLHRRVDDCAFGVCLLTRMGEDHLNLHGTTAAYHDAKRRLFTELASPGALIVAHANDPTASAVLGQAAEQALWIHHADSLPGNPVSHDPVPGLPGVSLADGALHLGREAAERLGTTPGALRLGLPVPVPHDLENAALAATAALGLGVPREAVEGALATYPGLPRRLQPIATGPFLVVDSMMNDPVLDQALGPALETLHCDTPIVALVGPRGSRGPRINGEFARHLGRSLGAVGVTTAEVTLGDDVLPEHDRVDADVGRAFCAGLDATGLAHRVHRRTDGAVASALDAVRAGGTLLLLGSEAVNPAGELVTRQLRSDGFDGRLAGTRVEQVRRAVDPRGRLAPVGTD